MSHLPLPPWFPPPAPRLTAALEAARTEAERAFRARWTPWPQAPDGWRDQAGRAQPWVASLEAVHLCAGPALEAARDAMIGEARPVQADADWAHWRWPMGWPALAERSVLAWRGEGEPILLLLPEGAAPRPFRRMLRLVG